MLHGCKLLLWLWLFMSFSISVSLTGLTKNQFKTHFWGTYRKGFLLFFVSGLYQLLQKNYWISQRWSFICNNISIHEQGIWTRFCFGFQWTVVIPSQAFLRFFISLKIILIILFFQCSYFRHYNVSNSFVVVVLG